MNENGAWDGNSVYKGEGRGRSGLFPKLFQYTKNGRRKKELGQSPMQ